MGKDKPVSHEKNRTSKGRFKKGVSGNPSGRPKSESAFIKQRLAERSEDIFKLWMDKIDEGDSAAIKMAIDRLIPPLKATTAPVQIAVDGESLADKANGVFGAAITGNVSADTASQLITALAGVAKIEEVTELEQRITALEKAKESKQ